VSWNGDRITDLSFSGEGCATSQTGASLQVMTQLLKNETKSECLAIIDEICKGFSGGKSSTQISDAHKMHHNCLVYRISCHSKRCTVRIFLSGLRLAVDILQSIGQFQKNIKRHLGP